MQHVVIIPETEWRQLAARLDKLEAAEEARQRPIYEAEARGNEVLTTAQAAAYLNLHPQALLRARKAGRLQGVRLNEKDWGFRRAALDAYPRRYYRATQLQAA